MNDLNEIKDVLNLEDSDLKKIPSMLNVLTILTYVGVGLASIGAIYNFFMICKSAEMFANMDSDAFGTGFAGKMMDTAMTLAVKQCENKTIIFVITILCCILCLVGAILMRKLKKQGFILYAAGELLFPIASFAILGSASLGGMMMVSSLIIPIVFVILYATQLKHLTN